MVAGKRMREKSTDIICWFIPRCPQYVVVTKPKPGARKTSLVSSDNPNTSAMICRLPGVQEAECESELGLSSRNNSTGDRYPKRELSPLCHTTHP